MAGVTAGEHSGDTVTGSTERDEPCAAGPIRWAASVLHCPVQTQVGTYFALERVLRFGRVAAAGVDAVIADPKMSRHHATLTLTGLVVELRDEGSSNGTQVNGVRISTQALEPGDIVRMGSTLLELGVAAPQARRAGSSMVGSSPAFLAALDRADRVAPSDLPVLILGETGTGKDVVACRIHEGSRRPGGLVAVNCAALPGGLVESALFGHKRGAFTGAGSDNPGFFLQAQNGTLFLDELGELPLEHQAKLLRAIDAREVVPVGGTRAVRVDVRVVAATNVDIARETEQGGFRSDLYARLAGTVIRMPPLRARRGDILDLAQHFIGRDGGEYRFSVQAAERLLLHPWPRNVRELIATMRRLQLELGERSTVTGTDVLAALDSPFVGRSPAAQAVPSRSAMADGRPARDELAAQLGALRGNVSRIAEHYGKDGKQIYRWLKHHGLDPRDYR